MIFIIVILLFIGSIFIHEITHILIAWYFNTNIPAIRINKLYIKIIPKGYLTIYQQMIFLGYPILTGMIFISLFSFSYPAESFIVMIAYFLSSGMDFYNLILLEVKR